MEKLDVINQKGEVVNSLQFDSPLWEVPFSALNVSLANRYYLLNKRQSTSKAKKRGEVNASTRKIYKQKGTGGARHGARSAPQFRGGGVAFGPTGEENYSLKINKKFKKNVLRSLIKEKVNKKEIIIIDNLSLNNYKTKEAESFLNGLSINKTKTLIVLADKEENKQRIISSFRNLFYVNITDSNSLNSLQLLSPKYLLFTHSAFVETEKRLS